MSDSERRVLHCIPTLGGGGAERQLAYLAGELPGLGWDVHVAYTRDGPNLARLARAGAGLHPIGTAFNHDPRLLPRLLRLCDAVRPAIVQTWVRQMDVLGGLVARRRGLRWVLSERSAEEDRERGLKSVLRARLARRACAVISNSPRGDRYWQARLPCRVIRRVIPNGLPLAEIEAAAPIDARELAGRALVLHVGRLAPEKRLGVLLEALARLRHRRDWAARLLGDGPLRAALEASAREGAIEGDVAFPGYVDGAWAWMKRASVLVSVSRREGHPNAVLEAMGCGCPLVVSDIPAHREILDERAALLVDGSSPAAVAAAIERVLDEPAAAAARAADARARVAALSTARVAGAWDAVYREVLDGATARA